jgi:hypothetical protein
MPVMQWQAGAKALPAAELPGTTFAVVLRYTLLSPAKELNKIDQNHAYGQESKNTDSYTFFKHPGYCSA